jgi:Fe(3+) dicitrate transport protein
MPTGQKTIAGAKINSPALTFLRITLTCTVINSDSQERPMMRPVPGLTALFLTAASQIGLSGTVIAAESSDRLDSIVVIGSRDGANAIPGSGQSIGPEALAQQNPFTVNEALRQVPGLFPRDEEGLGLRPNIGIRGLNPTRSTKVLLLEDGLPLSFAPYGDNASYYHPPLARYERIEILKGAGQIKFGPQTVGGIINYITPEAPDQPTAQFSFNGGNRGALEFDSHVGAPALGGKLLAQINYRQSNGARANHDLRFLDIYLKGQWDIAESQTLSLRLSRYAEDSQVSYSGLTEAEYAANPRGNPFPNDAFNTERFGASLLHGWQISDAATLKTSFYASRFSRDWWRQSSNSSQRPNDSSDPACGGLARLSTTCGNEGRLRDYTVFGSESRLQLHLGAFEINSGVRVHREVQDRLQWNGDTPTSRTPGTGINAGVREDNRRSLWATSGFLDARIDLGNLTLQPGVRVEHINYRRLNRLTNVSGSSSDTVVIPGLGATYALAPKLSVYGGVHRGFSPVRVEDVIDNTTGGSRDIQAEKSWNYELGLRGDILPGWRGDITLFLMDFANQTIASSLAGGTGGTPTSEGKTKHRGLELSSQFSSKDAALTVQDDIFVRSAITWVERAAFVGPRFSSIAGSTTISVAGNRLPYSPEWLISVMAGYIWADQLNLNAELQHTSRQFGDDLNIPTLAASANGQLGVLPAFTVINLNARLALPDSPWSLQASVKNVANTLYIADRSRGLLPGSPRQFTVGATIRF